MKTRAFTLIELLTVIAIIGVLAGLTLTVVSRVTAASRTTRCTNNLRQIGPLLLLFASDNKGALPSGLAWDQKIVPYMGNSYVSSSSSALFICPSDPRETSARPRSYAGSRLNPGSPGMGIFNGANYSLSPSIQNVVRPSHTVMICEIFTGGFSANTQFGSSFSVVDGWMNPSVAPKLSDGSFYHGTGHNYLFCDGHVEKLTPSQVLSAGGWANWPGGRWRAYVP